MGQNTTPGSLIPKKTADLLRDPASSERRTVLSSVRMIPGSADHRRLRLPTSRSSRITLGPSPNTARKASITAASTRSSWIGWPRRRSKDVTPRSAIPHGTIRSKWLRLVLTLRANPWLVTHREIRTPMAASLSLPDPRACESGHATGRHAKGGGGLDEHLLQIPDVSVNVASVRLQIHDWIADELTGAVVGDVATASRLEHGHALLGECFRGCHDVRCDRDGSSRRA